MEKIKFTERDTKIFLDALQKDPSEELKEAMKRYAERTTSVFTKAEELIYGDREKTYGDPSKNLARIAELWNQYLARNLREALRVAFIIRVNNEPTAAELRRLTELSKVELRISVTDVCHMMQLLKWARDENQPKEDNVIDDLGYGGLVHRCRTPEYVRSVPQGVMAEAPNSELRKPPKHAVSRKSQSKRKR